MTNHCSYFWHDIWEVCLPIIYLSINLSINLFIYLSSIHLSIIYLPITCLSIIYQRVDNIDHLRLIPLLNKNVCQLNTMLRSGILQESFWKNSSALMVAPESDHSTSNTRFRENFINKSSSLQPASFVVKPHCLSNSEQPSHTSSGRLECCHVIS